MTNKLTGIIRNIFTGSFVLLAFANLTSAQSIERAAFGANPAAIQAAVDQFRADLGALNPNNGQSFKTGRREINWDGVPDNFSSPNGLPPDFFNVNSPRGVVFSSTEGPVFAGPIVQPFQNSSSAASGVPLRFGNINPSYTAEFQAFSGQRIFTTTPGSNVIEISFFIPGTNIPATVNGFGAVFTDVDGQSTRMQFYDDKGKILFIPNGPIISFDKGLTFQGISYNDGTRISKVQLILGNASLSAANVDGVNGVDVVAMDDFIYGEPRAAEFHTGDFDGDGTTDATVFRPENGLWCTINSGSNTFDFISWGAPEDIPVDGDFDGDSRADAVIFRPAAGEWWIRFSSTGQFLGVSWGSAGDRPISGDFDKDGKFDIALWRPSDATYYILKSSTNFTTTQIFTWGATTDLPPQAAPTFNSSN